MFEYIDLSQALINAAEQSKGVTIIKSYDDEEYICYADILKNSLKLCAALHEIGATKGDEIIIQCKNLKYYMYSFWACALGGFIAVPTDVNRNEYMTEINSKIVNLLKKPFLLYDMDENVNAHRAFANKSINCSVLNYERMPDIVFDPNKNMFSKETIAYIQFTSGSTGFPKGAILRRLNISANAQGIIERHEFHKEDSIISWQPLTHCYGLIYYHMTAVFSGMDNYLIPTESYLTEPLIWLDAVNRHRITRIGTIPFALKHFINVYQKTKIKPDWDLSCVQSMAIGAEQVKAELCNQFVDLMQSRKLRYDVVKPAYGLSESTTIVCMGALGEKFKSHYIAKAKFDIGSKVTFSDDNDLDDLISYTEIGPAVSSVEMQIRDNDSNVLPDCTIGYLYIRGDSVTDGYYHNTAATNNAITEDGWLNTGDICFLVNGSMVFVGREKELIVSNGMKYACSDIEDIINKKIKHHLGQHVVCNGIDAEKSVEQIVVFIEHALDLNDTDAVNTFLQYSKDIKETVYSFFGLIIYKVISIESIPRTFSGKLKRQELSDRYGNGEFNELAEKLDKRSEPAANERVDFGSVTKERIRAVIVEIIEDLLKVDVLDYDLTFLAYGIMSVNIPGLIERINSVFGIDMQVSAFYNYPSINQLATFIYTLCNTKAEDRHADIIEKHDTSDEEKIAIIGMSCRFPGGANSIDDFWALLVSGKDGIDDIPKDRWDVDKYYDADENVPGKMYCKKGGFLDIDVNAFDAKFFNVSPKEALSLDPQQRLLLELTWEAFENAGLDITKLAGSNTGVYLGVSTNDYIMSHLDSGELSRIDAYSLTGICGSTACGRISYTFGFEGPSIAVDTACSSALTALHFAHQSMLNDEAELGVVGGVNLMLSPSANIGFSKLRATSPDGHSKAFDESADGYGRSEGAGVIILKKLSSALRDGDNILGVISASGINQDGRSNGLTAPNGASQEKLMNTVLAGANLSAADIDYIEMHGTGTKLGDPIEAGAVAATYGSAKSTSSPLKIGSVKSNIGHLEAGAGIASVIKVLLSMKNNLIPANLHFTTPNPLISWDKYNIKVVSEHTEWKNDLKLRRAGINGFGFGGSNAHVILEEFKANPIEARKQITGIDYTLKLSAKSLNSLRAYAQKYVDFLDKADDASLDDIVYDANTSRADFEYRLAVAGGSKDVLRDKLLSYLAGDEPEGVYYGSSENSIYEKDRKVLFMFTGQGSQYVNMGRFLFDNHSVFRESMFLCDRLFKPYILKSITDLLYGGKTSDDVIEKTVYAQPLIFSIEYSLYKYWESCGVTPEIVMGHSIGEYAAAVAAGILSLEDAVKLVSVRGRLMDSAPGDGSMGTIFADETTVAAMIDRYNDRISIAARNAKETCVISGDTDAVNEVLAVAEQRGIRVKKLKVSHGFHSPLMESIMADFYSFAQEITFHQPAIRFVSLMNASEIHDQTPDARYWTDHIRQKVDFYGGITSIKKSEDYVFIEVGAHRVLTSLSKLIFGDDRIMVGSLNVKRADAAQLADTIAQLYVAGVPIRWEHVEFAGKKRGARVQLPGYPFDRSVFSRDLIYDKPIVAAEAEEEHKLLGQKLESPFLENTVLFQKKFTAETPSFMAEHIIFNTPISPAAAHISMILSAAKELKNPRCATIKSIEFRAPLAVRPDETRRVQIGLNNVESDNMTFSIISSAVGFNEPKTNWTTHCQGLLSVSSDYMQTERSIDAKALEGMVFDFDIEQTLYQAMRSTGFDLGGNFRRVIKAVKDNDDTICFIEPLDSVPNLESYVMYPGVIDSILQTLVYTALKKAGIQTNKTMIPYFMGDLSFNFIEFQNLWCVSKANISDDILLGNITVFNEDGEVIMRINDFTGKLTDRATLLHEINNNFEGFYYHTDWVPAEKTSIQAPVKDERKYIAVADDPSVASIIKDGLTEQGIDAKALVIGASVSTNQEDSYIDTAGGIEDWRRAVAAIADNHKETKLKFIYTYGVKMAATESNLAEIDMNALKHLLYLTQAIDSCGVGSRSSIKIVTKNVHEIGNISTAELAQSMLWGFVRTFRIEFPDRYNGIVDIDDASLMSDRRLMIQELISDEADEICLRGNKDRYTLKLIKHTEYLKNRDDQPNEIIIDGAAAYLITGGTGALGLAYADRLAENGAKNIVLMCRSKPSERAKAKINSLKERGIKVSLAYADVCDKAAVARALESLDNTVPPIKGVIHTAGALRDKLLIDQTWADYQSVLGPKVLGTANVYKAVKENGVDFFIMLSSVTAVIGNIGQSNYAAANNYLNHAAAYMRRNGVPGYAICWGPWQEGGMAAENAGTGNSLRSMGLEMLSLETGITVIDEFFHQPINGLIVVDADWKTLASNDPFAKKTFLSKIARDEPEKAPAEPAQAHDAVMDVLIAMREDERTDYLVYELQKICGKIMGFDKDHLPDKNTAIKEQGADSLMTFSMRSALNKLLHIELSVSDFFNYSTLSKLADYIINELLFPQSAIDNNATEDTDDLLSELAALID